MLLPKLLAAESTDYLAPQLKHSRVARQKINFTLLVGEYIRQQLGGRRLEFKSRLFGTHDECVRRLAGKNDALGFHPALKRLKVCVIEPRKIPAVSGTGVLNENDRFRGSVEGKQAQRSVDGGGVYNPKNVFVPIGTSISDLLDFCGGVKDSCRKILMGGPMMGITVCDINMPVIKNNNAILALSEDQVAETEESACIRCGRCIYACPMRLMPRALEMAYDSRNVEALKKGSLNLCMNCGCCTFVCPAKRNLAQKNQLAKAFVRQADQKKK